MERLPNKAAFRKLLREQIYGMRSAVAFFMDIAFATLAWGGGLFIRLRSARDALAGKRGVETRLAEEETASRKAPETHSRFTFSLDAQIAETQLWLHPVS
jgi:hypothetical protein